MIALKPDGGYGFFDVGATLSGTWSTDTPDHFCTDGTFPPPEHGHLNCAGFGLSHITLYGILDGTRQETPEPSTLLLLGLGLLALATVARTRVVWPS